MTVRDVSEGQAIVRLKIKEGQVLPVSNLSSESISMIATSSREGRRSP
jgi:hypothetical protein